MARKVRANFSCHCLIDCFKKNNAILRTIARKVRAMVDQVVKYKDFNIPYPLFTVKYVINV